MDLPARISSSAQFNDSPTYNLTKTSNGTEASLSTASHMAVGIYLLFTGSVGVIGNATFVMSLIKLRRSLTIHEMFLINLAVTDIGVCLTGYPWAVASSFSQRWIFGEAGCQWYGFCGFFFGNASITTLGVISWDRFSTISTRRHSFKIYSRRRAAAVTAGIWLFALFWATAPLLGWSEYSPEPYKTSCTVKWHGQNAKDISLLMCLFIFVIGINLFVISFSYCGVVAMLRNRRVVPSLASTTSQKAQRKTTLISFVVVVSFLICWMPYAFFSLWHSFFQKNRDVPLEATVVPALLAKSSSYINPIIYVITMKKYRILLWSTFCGFCSDGVSKKNLRPALGPPPVVVRPIAAVSVPSTIRTTSERHLLTFYLENREFQPSLIFIKLLHLRLYIGTGSWQA